MCKLRIRLDYWLLAKLTVTLYGSDTVSGLCCYTVLYNYRAVSYVQYYRRQPLRSLVICNDITISQNRDLFIH